MLLNFCCCFFFSFLNIVTVDIHAVVMLYYFLPTLLWISKHSLHIIILYLYNITVIVISVLVLLYYSTCHEHLCSIVNYIRHFKFLELTVDAMPPPPPCVV